MFVYILKFNSIFMERNNFHTNNFKNSIILRFFRPSPCRFWRTYAAVHLPPNGSGGLIFGDGSDDFIPAYCQIWPGTTRHQPVSIPLRESETSLLRQYMYLKKRTAGRSSLHLRRHLKSWTEVAVRTAKSSLYRNQSRDDSLGLFGLKISWDLARAILM